MMLSLRCTFWRDSSFSSGRWTATIWVHRPSFSSLLFPRCSRARDYCGDWHCSGTLCGPWSHDSGPKLPGCVSIWSLEWQGDKEGGPQGEGGQSNSRPMLVDGAGPNWVCVIWSLCLLPLSSSSLSMSKAPASSPALWKWWMGKPAHHNCSLRLTSSPSWRSMALVSNSPEDLVALRHLLYTQLWVFCQHKCDFHIPI